MTAESADTADAGGTDTESADPATGPTESRPTGEAVEEAPDDALFRLVGLTKHFEDEDWLAKLRPGWTPTKVRAVDDVDLAVREGETLGLVGESGCGKSTLARAALRLLEPTAGRVYYDGEEVTAFTDEELRAFRGEAQMIFQDPYASLNPRYKVRKTLVEPMAVHDIGDTRRERIDRAADLLDRVGLAPDMIDRYPHEFSGGQRQRIAIARALAVEPKLIVADEMVSALDVSVQAQILNLLRDLREDMGLTMLFISHDLSVIRRITDRVAVMYLGEVVETGDTDGLFREPHHPYSQALLSSIPVPDPTVERERIPLEGDVPTPIDPPKGCRFHPRCPRVIPPEDWTGSQEEWRRLLQFKASLRSGVVDPDAVRSEFGDEPDVAGAVYDEYIARTEVTDAETVELHGPVERDVREAIDILLDEGHAAAAESLDADYTTVCERDVPVELDVEGRQVLCHLYDETRPGSPPAREQVTGLDAEVDVDAGPGA